MEPLSREDLVSKFAASNSNLYRYNVVLDAMAKTLPLGSFEKLGLSAVSLRSAMTSISASLTTLRTSTIGGGGGGGNRMTARTLMPAENREVAFAKQDVPAPTGFFGKIGAFLKQGQTLFLGDSGRDEFKIFAENGWRVYKVGGVSEEIVSKQAYDFRRKTFVDLSLSEGATGVAIRSSRFAAGVERAAFKCTEVSDVHESGRRGVAGLYKLNAVDPFESTWFQPLMID
jgi:hypothetical protein